MITKREHLLIYGFLQAQNKNVSKNDWVQTVKDNLEYFWILIKSRTSPNSSSNYWGRNLLDKTFSITFSMKILGKRKGTGKVANLNYQEHKFKLVLTSKTLTTVDKKFIKNRMKTHKIT